MNTAKTAEKMITKLVAIWQKVGAPGALSEPNLAIDIWDLAALSGVITKKEALQRREAFMSGATDDLPAIQKFMKEKGWLSIVPRQGLPAGLCPTAKALEYIESKKYSKAERKVQRVLSSPKADESRNIKYDSFIIHEYSTGNPLARVVKEGLQHHKIKTFVAPQDVPVGADEQSVRYSALSNAEEIFVLITSGMLDEPGEVKNEIAHILSESKDERIRPYRKEGIGSHDAVEFLQRMGIKARKQCPTFQNAADIIDDVVQRRGKGEYFKKAGTGDSHRNLNSTKMGDVPQSIGTYLTQLRFCLSQCKRECYGNHSWCRMTAEFGLVKPYYVVPRIKRSSAESRVTSEKLDKYILRWLAKPEQRHLAILGDSGSGKSSACVMIASDAAENVQQGPENGLIPILLPLESMVRHQLLGEGIPTLLKRMCGIDLAEGTISSLIADKRFLFILDGFDEISDRADHPKILRNLAGIEPILRSGCKVILTCRTHFFADQEQVEQVLVGESDGGTELYAAFARNSPNFKIIELQDFSIPEIKQLIRKKNPKNSTKLWTKIKELYNLADLSRRPLLLMLILDTLPTLIQRRSKIDRTALYDAYTGFWLNREAKRVESDVDPKTKEQFVEDLAIQMWSDNLGSIRYEELRDTIQKKYAGEIVSRLDFYVRDYDTRNASFLNRDNNGYYRFMHRSFMEYFTALRCVRTIRRDSKNMNCWDIRWFDKEIAGFISELVQRPSNTNKIGILADLCLTEKSRTLLWNVLHILSLIDDKSFSSHAGVVVLNKIVQRAEEEQSAVVLRQYCRVIAKFGSREKAENLIRRVIDIARSDDGQNTDNNNTYINYYYGKSSACEALLNHLSTREPKYDRELHIYVLGQLGEKRHAEKLQKLAETWKNQDHVRMARAVINELLFPNADRCASQHLPEPNSA